MLLKLVLLPMLLLMMMTMMSRRMRMQIMMMRRGMMLMMIKVLEVGYNAMLSFNLQWHYLFLGLSSSWYTSSHDFSSKLQSPCAPS